MLRTFSNQRKGRRKTADFKIAHSELNMLLDAVAYSKSVVELHAFFIITGVHIFPVMVFG